MGMSQVVCLFLTGTNRRAKRSLKGWLSSYQLKLITSQKAIQAFVKDMEDIYARLDNHPRK